MNSRKGSGKQLELSLSQLDYRMRMYGNREETFLHARNLMYTHNNEYKKIVIYNFFTAFLLPIIVVYILSGNVLMCFTDQFPNISMPKLIVF